MVKLDKKKKKLLIILTTGLLIGFTISFVLKGKLYANIGISTEKILFWSEKGTLKKGDYVQYHLIHPILPRPADVVKQVRCMPGENLIVTDKEAICEGEKLGDKKKFTKDGRLMPKFNFSGVIPEKKYFLLNNHRDSFDSRYYGLVERDKLKRLKVLY